MRKKKSTLLITILNTGHEDSSSTSMKFEPVVWRAIISTIVFIDEISFTELYGKV